MAFHDTAVVVPTLNESENISKLIETVFGLYPEIHILVVDDHSPDGTSAIVQGLQSKHPNLMLLERTRHPGLGCSYRDGFRQALAQPWCRALVMMDADFSHDPAVIGHLLAKLADHDVVVGSRYTQGGSVKNWNWRRRILSRGANLYVCAVLWLPVFDATAGFIGVRREALETIPYGATISNGYAFLVELKYLLGRFRLRFTEHPIAFDERREGQSKMSVGNVWESVLLPWRIRSAERRPLERHPIVE